MILKVINNIIKTKTYLNLSLFIVSLLICITLILQLNVIPTLKKIAFDNILTEARKVSLYMSNLIDYENEKVENIDEKLKNLIVDFNIDKIHYFNKNGKTTYSTSKEKIGYVNNHSYFKDIVSKGKPYYSIKLKNSKSSEFEVIEKDVIEIYVPIMEGKRFIGAFELYYDISENVEEFNKYADSILRVNIIMVFLIFSLFLYLIYLISAKSLNEKELRSKDYLTNLYNRRYFYEIVGKYISLSKREKTPISVCMIDIDNFKQVNDNFGHHTGDEVLKVFSIETKNIIRESDLLVRFVGEEFLLFLPNTSIDHAEILANKICKHFQTLNNKVPFTISLGISQYDSNQNINETINMADKALNKAKKDGKNKVIKYTKEDVL